MPLPPGDALQIRAATAADRTAIDDVHRAAFPADECTQVASLASDLLAEHTTPAVLTLVAEVGRQLVGHVAFSPVSDPQDDQWRGCLLAPLGILPQWQRRGVGSKLVAAGMQRLRDDGVHRLFVYGDPDYYSRFGFRAVDTVRYPAPYPLTFPHGWQSLVLNPWPEPTTAAALQCVFALRKPELW
jgi:putative acetyltransferase